MTVTINGTTGIANDGGYTGDGIIFANTTPANTLVTDTSGNVGIGTTAPDARLSISYSALGSGGANNNTLRSGFGLTGAGTSQPLSAFRFTNVYFTGIGGTNYANQWVTDSANCLTTEIVNTGATPIIFGTSATERARIDSSGNLLVNRTGQINQERFGVTTATDIACSTNRASSTAYYPWIFYSNSTTVGYIYSTSTATSYVTSSDYRLKHDIQPMTGALAKVSALKPVTYKWNADDSAGEGFIAHELAEVVPQCVTGEKDAVDADGNPQYQGIDTSFLVATLTAAIQEQQAIITQLQADVAALKGA